MAKRLLIIDDDRAIAQLTALRMRAAGYAVDLAFNGIAGLARAQAAPPDAILLDIRMPDLDGFEVYARLKADTRLAGTPVIFLSANVQETARKQAIAAGAAAFLAKPYEIAHIIDAVERAVATCGSNAIATE